MKQFNNKKHVGNHGWQPWFRCLSWQMVLYMKVDTSPVMTGENISRLKQIIAHWIAEVKNLCTLNWIEEMRKMNSRTEILLMQTWQLRHLILTWDSWQKMLEELFLPHWIWWRMSSKFLNDLYFFKAHLVFTYTISMLRLLSNRYPCYWMVSSSDVSSSFLGADHPLLPLYACFLPLDLDQCHECSQMAVVYCDNL